MKMVIKKSGHERTSLFLLLFLLFFIPRTAAASEKEFRLDDGRLPACVVIVQRANFCRQYPCAEMEPRLFLNEFKKQAEEFGFKRIVTEDDPEFQRFLAESKISLKKLHGEDKFGNPIEELLTPFLVRNNIPILWKIVICSSQNGVSCSSSCFTPSILFFCSFGTGNEPADEVSREDMVGSTLEKGVENFRQPRIRAEVWENFSGEKALEFAKKNQFVLIRHPADQPFPKAVFLAFETSMSDSGRDLPIAPADRAAILSAIRENMKKELLTDLIVSGDPAWSKAAAFFKIDGNEIEHTPLRKLDKKLNFTAFARKAGASLVVVVTMNRTVKNPDTIIIEFCVTGTCLTGEHGFGRAGYSMVMPVGGNPEKNIKKMTQWAHVLRNELGPRIWDPRINRISEQAQKKSGRQAPETAPFPDIPVHQDCSTLAAPGMLRTETANSIHLPDGATLMDVCAGEDGMIYLASRTPEKQFAVSRLAPDTMTLETLISTEKIAAAPNQIPSHNALRFDVRDGRAVLIYPSGRSPGNAGIFDFSKKTFTPLRFLPGPAAACAWMNGKVYLLFVSTADAVRENRHLLLECGPDGRQRRIVFDNGRMERTNWFDRSKIGPLCAIAADPARNRLLVFSPFAVRAFYPASGEVIGIAEFSEPLISIVNTGHGIEFATAGTDIQLYRYSLAAGRAERLCRIIQEDPGKKVIGEVDLLASRFIVVDPLSRKHFRGRGTYISAGPYFFSSARTGTAFDMTDAARSAQLPELPNLNITRILPAPDGTGVILFHHDGNIVRLKFLQKNCEGDKK